MLERMARAMWEQRRKKTAEDYPTLPPLEAWGDGSVPKANGIMEEARAGLEATREATESMLAAGEDFCTSNGMAGCWNAMLDVILTEQQA